MVKCPPKSSYVEFSFTYENFYFSYDGFFSSYEKTESLRRHLFRSEKHPFLLVFLFIYNKVEEKLGFVTFGFFFLLFFDNNEPIDVIL